MGSKLDMDVVRKSFQMDNGKREIGVLQVVAYVAAGGGLIGRMYAEQPADAYRDTRSGRGPYEKRTTSLASTGRTVRRTPRNKNERII